MEPCKDCIHFEMCELLRNGKCAFFKNRDLFVELPCKIGEPVFIIGGKYRSGRFEQWINPGKFRLSDLEKIGKTVFLTRSEAESALAKMK